MNSQSTGRVWVLLQRIAIFLYCGFSLMLIRQKPGLSYDEALQVVGAVHMLHSPHVELTVPHDPNTWVPVFGRWIPLMTVRYTGAIKEYLALLPFKIFGPRAPVVRIICMLFGAIGIWGMAVLVRAQAGRTEAAIFAIALALNPAYVDSTIFDAGTVAIFMASMGLLALAVSSYLEWESARAAFWMGCAVGFGVWMRSNFLWLVAAVGVAVLCVFWKELARPVSHYASLAAGAVVGALPLIVYQIVSKGGTFEAVGMFPAHDSIGQRILTRLVLFSETMLADREHRAMWNGPPMPDWQSWLFPLVALGCCVICVMGKSRFARVLAISFLLFGAILFLAGVQVAEHHLIALLPFAVALCVLGFASLHETPYWAAAWVVAILYAGSAIYWQGMTNQGLLTTGGVGIWSDSVVTLASELDREFSGRTVKFLDWGLYNPVYVLTNARINGGEIFPDSTAEKSGRGLSWTDEIREGGVFVLFPPERRQIPLASEAFLNTMEKLHVSSRQITIPQRDGSAYALIVDVAP